MYIHLCTIIFINWSFSCHTNTAIFFILWPVKIKKIKLSNTLTFIILLQRSISLKTSALMYRKSFWTFDSLFKYIEELMNSLPTNGKFFIRPFSRKSFYWGWSLFIIAREKIQFDGCLPGKKKRKFYGRETRRPTIVIFKRYISFSKQKCLFFPFWETIQLFIFIGWMFS